MRSPSATHPFQKLGNSVMSIIGSSSLGLIQSRVWVPISSGAPMTTIDGIFGYYACRGNQINCEDWGLEINL